MILRILAGAPLAVLLSAAPIATTDHAGAFGSVETASAATVDSSAVAARSSWKCGAWNRDGHGGGDRWCVRFERVVPQVREDYHTLIHNGFKQTVTATCRNTHTTTWSFHTEGTVEAEAGVIFAKAKTSLTAGASRTTETADEVGTEFPLKPGRWAYCARGHAWFLIKGVSRHEVCGEPGCRYFSGGRFKARVPSSPFFEMGPGKHIDWRRFLPQA